MHRNLTFTMLLLFATLPAYGQIKRITIKVDGLACAFCAYGLEKALKRVEGIGEVKIFVDEGRAELGTRVGKTVDLDAIEPSVRQSGYTPREITLEAAGKYAEWEGRPALFLDDDGTKLLLDGTDIARKLTEALAGAGKDRKVTVLGKLKQEQPSGHRGHPRTLVLESFQAK